MQIVVIAGLLYGCVLTAAIAICRAARNGDRRSSGLVLGDELRRVEESLGMRAVPRVKPPLPPRP